MTPVKSSSIAAGALGVISIVGGTLGFVNAGSKASLIAGGISGVLLLVSAVLMPKKTTAGAVLAIVVSLALLAKFGRTALQQATVLSIVMSVGALAVVVLSARARRVSASSS
jgi:uncharacterized membrane protein (UPF0136 family)